MATVSSPVASEPSLSPSHDPEMSLWAACVGDGRPLLVLLALGLMASGAFALFLAATGSFLPHDIAYLGMDPRALCDLHACRVVHFMFHDRVSFGGTLLAIGTLYLWLLAFPLRRGEEWAWWTLLLSGTVGFLSFLTYLLFGYLDTWHAVATAALLPLFVLGMARTRRQLLPPPSRQGWKSLLPPAEPLQFRSRSGLGRICLLATGTGMTLAGSVIAILGATVTFVPQDLEYLNYTRAQLNAINPHLIPLIAHDRAGFGGGLASCGIAVLLIVWKSLPSRGRWQALLLGGLAGFGCAIGIHFPMGYRSASHLLPAFIGGGLYAAGMIWTRPPQHREAAVLSEGHGFSNAVHASDHAGVR